MRDNLYNKIQAEDLFLQKKYNDSLLKYASVLQKFPNDKDARIGVILSDMASEREDEAQAIFDYYLILKKQNPIDAVEVVEEIVETIDFNINQMTNKLIKSLEIKADYSNGISYQDFKQLVKINGNFKQVFENIMFSTKIIVIGKEEFMEFLSGLIENNFNEMALAYLDGAVDFFRNDPQLRKLFEKLNEKKEKHSTMEV